MRAYTKINLKEIEAGGAGEVEARGRPREAADAARVAAPRGFRAVRSLRLIAECNRGLRGHGGTRALDPGQIERRFLPERSGEKRPESPPAGRDGSAVVPLTQEELAEFAGAARATVNRVLPEEQARRHPRATTRQDTNPQSRRAGPPGTLDPPRVGSPVGLSCGVEQAPPAVEAVANRGDEQAES